MKNRIEGEKKKTSQTAGETLKQVDCVPGIKTFKKPLKNGQRSERGEGKATFGGKTIQSNGEWNNFRHKLQTRGYGGVRGGAEEGGRGKSLKTRVPEYRVESKEIIHKKMLNMRVGNTVLIEVI